MNLAKGRMHADLRKNVRVLDEDLGSSNNQQSGGKATLASINSPL
jgi:hypothetical protein